MWVDIFRYIKIALKVIKVGFYSNLRRTADLPRQVNWLH